MRARTIGAVVVGLVVASVSQIRADYQTEVLADEPVAYWRLGDADAFSGAADASDTLLDAVYAGDPLLEEDGLLVDDPDTAVAFNGIDAEIQIPDNALINTGGPWQARTIELWFQAEVVDVERRVLFEEGGATRGVLLFVEEVNGVPTLYMSAWNRAQESWNPVTVSTEIELEETYHAVLVLDASANDVFGDFDGRVTGYLNGQEFGTAIGADQLYAHGDDCAIGGIHVNTYFPDGTNPGDGGNFIGVIDEVAVYNIALDDPDGDEDRSDSRVVDHYVVGSQSPDCPLGLSATAAGADVRLAWRKGAETSVRVLRGGVELAAAAPVDPPEYVDMNPPPGVLDYELQFTLPDATCSLPWQFDGCTSGLTVTQVGGGIQLDWRNGLLYSGIVVMRGDEVIATLGGDETTYIDASPPVGFWTYSVAPSEGTCSASSAQVCVLGTGYSQMVVDDGAGAYWRLGEASGTVAGNCGSEGLPLNGTYSGNVELGGGSLLATVDDFSVVFDGVDSEVLIPDTDYINLGGPFQTRTIELWFQADFVDTEPRVLYEEGGNDRGLGMYVREIDGERLLIMAGWNRDDTQGYWDKIGVRAPIEEGAIYHAVMVFDASANDVLGDYDGRITGYLNGQEFDTMVGADQLYQHTGNIAIGSVDNDMRFMDDTTIADGAYFQGSIDEVAVYETLLDDPNDDGDRSDSRVLDHFLTGAGVESCPTNLIAEHDGGNVKLSWSPGVGETSVRVARDGVELAASAPVDPPEYVDTAVEPGEFVYELTFDSADCPTLTRRFDGCITDLSASATVGAVELNWTNNFAYTGIVVERGADVIATLDGDAVSYADTDAPVGPSTYSVVPEGGDCEPVTIDVRVFESEYPTKVIDDGADAYWRLDETDPLALVAVNSGSAGTSLDGAYTGTVLLENDSLLPADPDNPSILLEGIDGHVVIPDSSFTNTGGPFHAKTVELWFQAEVIDLEPRILFEQGGTTRGLNLYVQEVGGTPTLFMGAWNLAEEQWGPVAVSAEIEAEAVYHAVMVFDASENDTFGDFDGRVTGYLNGEEIDTMIGADQLYAHSNDTAIGAVTGGETKLADGTNKTSDGFFIGSIDEVSLYNILLDDPDGDKDLSDSLVMAHYLAGTEEGGGPELVSLKPGDVNGDGSFNIADMVAQLGFQFGGGSLPECYVVPGTQELNATGLDILDYNGDGSSNIADAVAGLGGLFGGGGPHVLGEGCAEIEGTCQSSCQ